MSNACEKTKVIVNISKMTLTVYKFEFIGTYFLPYLDSIYYYLFLLLYLNYIELYFIFHKRINQSIMRN